jgi:hypothetical protein
VEVVKDGELERTLEVRFETGNRIRGFGSWYRHDSVYVNGVRLAGFIQIRRRNKRTESTTHFQPLSCCVLGSDWKWLYRMHLQHDAVAIANGFKTISEVQS